MKQHYKTIKRIGDTANTAYWVTEDPAIAHKFLVNAGFDFVMPLGDKRPRDIPKDMFNKI